MLEIRTDIGKDDVRRAGPSTADATGRCTEPSGDRRGLCFTRDGRMLGSLDCQVASACEQPEAGTADVGRDIVCDFVVGHRSSDGNAATAHTKRGRNRRRTRFSFDR